MFQRLENIFNTDRFNLIKQKIQDDSTDLENNKK